MLAMEGCWDSDASRLELRSGPMEKFGLCFIMVGNFERIL